MGKKGKLISAGVQLAAALVVAYLIYRGGVGTLDVTLIEYRQYDGNALAWQIRCWCDALFIPGVLWLGFGGLMWVASTGFFDIFSYAFKSVLVLFAPLLKSRIEPFYDYKLAKEEKRAGTSVSHTVLIVGVILLVASIALNVAHAQMVEPVELPGSGAQAQTTQLPQATDEPTATPLATDAAPTAVPDPTPELADDTTGGTSNE